MKRFSTSLFRTLNILAATALLSLFAGCEEETAKEGILVNIYGPPPDQYPDQAKFDAINCNLLKICHMVEKDPKLRGCVTVPFTNREANLGSLPLNKEISIVAECYVQASDGSGKTVMTARGQSAPVVHKKSEAEEIVNIYVLPVSTFGPTFDDFTQTATSPMVSRWGAVVVPIFDGTILIAGGAQQYKEDCTDWSKPECAVKTTSLTEIYDPGKGTFAATVEALNPITGFPEAIQLMMTKGRSFAAAVELPSGEIAIFGGLGDNGDAQNTVDIYDPFSRSFTVEMANGLAVPGMTHSRAYHTATLISALDTGYVLLVGGMGTGEGTWEVWSPDYGTLATGNLQESRQHHTATLVSPELDSSAPPSVLIAGGEGGPSGSRKVRNTIEIFDINNQTLSPALPFLCSNMGPQDPPAVAKTMHAAALVPKRHFIYVGGGFSDPEHKKPAKDICVWHTVQQTWKGQTGAFALKKPRGALSATSLPGNAVLLAGGLAASGGEMLPADTVEIVFEYLSETGDTIVDIGPGDLFPIPMMKPRWQHTAVLASDGKVLFVGGLGSKSKTTLSPTPMKDTELFNPQTF